MKKPLPRGLYQVAWWSQTIEGKVLRVENHMLTGFQMISASEDSPVLWCGYMNDLPVIQISSKKLEHCIALELFEGPSLLASELSLGTNIDVDTPRVYADPSDMYPPQY